MIIDYLEDSLFYLTSYGKGNKEALGKAVITSWEDLAKETIPRFTEYIKETDLEIKKLKQQLDELHKGVRQSSSPYVHLSWKDTDHKIILPLGTLVRGIRYGSNRPSRAYLNFSLDEIIKWYLEVEHCVAKDGKVVVYEGK